MKMIRLFLFACLLPAFQSIKAQENPEPRKDIRKPVDSSWTNSLAGDKLLVNGQLLTPAGQSLSLTKGTRVLNLAFAHNKNLLIAKTNRRLSFIDAKDFKTLSAFDYQDKESALKILGRKKC